MAKQNNTTTTTFTAGDVVHVAEACLPYLVIEDFYPDGEEEGGAPTYTTRPLQPLSDFSRADKEAGLPGCRFVRNHEWLWEDEIREAEGEDLVITGRVIRLVVEDPRDFSERVRIVGRISPGALDALQRKLLAIVLSEDNPFEGIDLEPREAFDAAISLALGEA